MTQRVEVFFFNMTRRIEPFLFSNMTQRIDFQNAQGIEPLFHMIYLLFYMTRIELFFDQYDSKSRIFHKKWLKVLNTFFNLTERVELFLHWTQRIELFSICLKELSLFLNMSPKVKIFLKNNPIPKNDSKNWTPFCLFQQWLKELNSL